MTVINLTQHVASPEQVEAGVLDLDGAYREMLLDILNFVGQPTSEDVLESARDLAFLMERCIKRFDEPDLRFMLGGAPFLMAQLSNLEVFDEDLQSRILFAFSERESVERTLPDGSVQKTAVFKHKGFIPLHP